MRRRAEFLKLFDSPNKISAKGFLIVWQMNALNTPRLGITVSKKVGCAVVRNRIKRSTREVFRMNRHQLPLVDLNVIARRESALMDFASIKWELEKAFRHIGASTCSKELFSS
ncbi:ribonuclease P protein component [Pelotalea chapellei]|uniref:Ribonuclease P protein component n=1 Tax=Pelotalea chapellei TaxID=44671 RepID=A0ABS5U4W8_9BACT|nr:ribonuclease P protein component [Pelotalea chapellei]